MGRTTRRQQWGRKMPDFARDCLKARNDGRIAASDPVAHLALCPYDEIRDPVLRAMWQDGFVVTRLYWSES